MRTRIVWGLLALALAAAASATASSTTQTAGPKLALLHRAPLVVRGSHFHSGELVRLTAAAGTTHAAALARATRTGGFVAHFHYAPPVCLKLLVLATGKRGDHARLVVKPPGGPSGIPCGQWADRIADAVVDVPAAGSGDSGLEGFTVGGAAGRLGRVAALNRLPDGIVLVVDTGDDYRVVRASAVDRVETRPRTVRLSAAGEEALAAGPAVEPRVLRIDSPALVRHLPRELDGLLVEGGPAAGPARSALWVLGATLTIVAGVAIFVGATITAEVGAPALAWLWLLWPLALLVTGLALLWRALGSGNGRRLSGREKASDALTFLLGITPRTRRRG